MRSAILVSFVRYCLKRRFVRGAAFVWQVEWERKLSFFKGTALDATTIDFLRQVNNDFYARCAPSFSATRNAPWVGWRTCLEAAQGCGSLRLCDDAALRTCDGAGMHSCDNDCKQPGGGADVLPFDDTDARSCDDAGMCSCGCATVQPGTNRSGASVRVLDAACGNMRFAAFLREELRGRDIDYFAVDDCAGLVPHLPAGEGFSACFQNLDIIGELAAGVGLAGAIDADACDLVGCFGFFHHVPSFELRAQLIDALLQKAAPGGIVCVSFWQFMGDEKFAKKAEAWNSKATSELVAAGLDASQLEAGDYFLGWQNEPGLWRYCHHFEEWEIDALIDSLCSQNKAREIARFFADGKSGAMNRYVVLQKR